MSGAAWNLEPRLSALISAALTMLAIVLVASLTVAIVGALTRRLARFGSRAQAPRFYVGRLERSAPSVFVVDSAVRPLPHAGPAPRPFGWGGVDQGGVHLARSVLLDVSGSAPKPEQVRRFVDEVVSALPDDGFVLATERVQRWLREQRRRRPREERELT